jgi:hypothetical protein
MKITGARIGRLPQYLGVAMAAHAATMHASVKSVFIRVHPWLNFILQRVPRKNRSLIYEH